MASENEFYSRGNFNSTERVGDARRLASGRYNTTVTIPLGAKTDYPWQLTY